MVDTTRTFVERIEARQGHSPAKKELESIIL